MSVDSSCSTSARSASSVEALVLPRRWRSAALGKRCCSGSRGLTRAFSLAPSLASAPSSWPPRSFLRGVLPTWIPWLPCALTRATCLRAQGYCVLGAPPRSLAIHRASDRGSHGRESRSADEQSRDRSSGHVGVRAYQPRRLRRGVVARVDDYGCAGGLPFGCN